MTVFEKQAYKYINIIYFYCFVVKTERSAFINDCRAIWLSFSLQIFGILEGVDNWKSQDLSLLTNERINLVGNVLNTFLITFDKTVNLL